MVKIPALYLEELVRISESLAKLDDEIDYLGVIKVKIQLNEDPDTPDVGKFVWENDQWYFLPGSFFEDA